MSAAAEINDAVLAVFRNMNPGAVIDKPSAAALRSKKCKHALQIKIAQTGNNKGKAFWSCGAKQGECDGSFFDWAGAADQKAQQDLREANGWGRKAEGTHMNGSAAAPAGANNFAAIEASLVALNARLIGIETALQVVMNRLDAAHAAQSQPQPQPSAAFLAALQGARAVVAPMDA